MWFPTLKSYRVIDLDTGSELTFAQSIADTATLAIKAANTSNVATSGVVVVPLTEEYSGYTTNATAAIAATLADGVDGQTKIIKLELKTTSNMVVTFNTDETLTFDATAECAILRFVADKWQVITTTATLA